MISRSYVVVYIDESGDLGFSKRASKVFIIAYVIPNQDWALRTALRRLAKRLRGRRVFSGEEFKFSRDSNKVRQTVFKKIILSRKPELQFDVGLVVIDKSFVKQNLREKPTILYNYLAVHHVATNVLAKYSPSDLRFVVDKSMSKTAREAFNEYVNMKVAWKAGVESSKQIPKVEVSHVDSHKEPCL